MTAPPVSDLIAIPGLARDAITRGRALIRGSVSGNWLSRAQRVVLILLAVWTLNLFDLIFTLREARVQHFIEMNPIAARLLDGPSTDLIAYKTCMVAFGSAILLSFRRYRVVELACWFLLAAYLYVGVRWSIYYAGAMALADDLASLREMAGC